MAPGNGLISQAIPKIWTAMLKGAIENRAIPMR
jgi:hypothetical protein